MSAVLLCSTIIDNESISKFYWKLKKKKCYKIILIYAVVSSDLELKINKKFFNNSFIYLFILVAIWNHHGVNKEECSALLYSYTVDNSEQYPMGIGVNFTEDLKNQMTLYLVNGNC